VVPGKDLHVALWSEVSVSEVFKRSGVGGGGRSGRLRRQPWATRGVVLPEICENIEKQSGVDNCVLVDASVLSRCAGALT
jgi:hypothetical protein